MGKWHLDGHGRDSYIPPKRRQGFDYWKVLECTHDYNASHYYADDDPTLRTWEGYDAYAQTKDAQAYIRDHANNEKPFFLFVGYGGPHFPHNNAPDELKALYPPAEIQLRPNVTQDQAERSRKELQGYYAHCTAIDSSVGDLYTTLEQCGIAEDTVFVFTSDHGDMHGSQGMKSYMKQVPWDESVRVPFLLRYPPLQNGGRVVKTTLNTPDILPSLLSLVGVDVPDTVEGEDLSAVLAGRDDDPDRFGLFMSVAPFGVKIKAYRGIRNASYTYVRDSNGPWLLYANRQDPYQTDNLIDDPACRELREELDAALQRQLEQNGDRVMTRDEALEKWGYETNEGEAIPYLGQFKCQSPGPDKGDICHFPARRVL